MAQRCSQPTACPSAEHSKGVVGVVLVALHEIPD
jgi:hypothetical protein